MLLGDPLVAPRRLPPTLPATEAVVLDDVTPAAVLAAVSRLSAASVGELVHQ